MNPWSDDPSLFALARQRLFPAVVGDILDAMGFMRQFLPADVRALRPDMVVIGRAMPVLEADFPVDPRLASTHNTLLGKPFGLLFRALGELRGRAPPPRLVTRAYLAAAFAGLVLHTLLYAAFLEDPITWTLIGLGIAIRLTPGEASSSEDELLESPSERTRTASYSP